MTMRGALPAVDLPVVVAVRGTSKSGKTTLCTQLVAYLQAEGVRTAWAKRSHHPLDVPGKASARIWAEAPAAMAVRSPDRRQLTLPPGPESASNLVALLSPYADVVLFETHSPEPYPTLLVSAESPPARADILGRWRLDDAPEVARELARQIRALLPKDLEAARIVREARNFHGGHGCPGVVLGARLALEAARALELTLPDTEKRLIVVAETERCAVDALIAVTGCRPGRRTLRVDDQGKLAARFYDLATRRAVRVATRPGLRALASELYPHVEPFEAQRGAYAVLPAEALFEVRAWPFDLTEEELPGRPRGRVNCAVCGEEVVDGRHIEREAGAVCRACAAEAPQRGVLA